MPNLLVKQKTMVSARENAWFEKALRLMENDIWSNIPDGRNKVVSRNCSIKHFLMPYSARIMTLIPPL